jgi:myo-inositol 2-dehydrogenase/D-chiro-inositol 1-dehydrogenase
MSPEEQMAAKRYGIALVGLGRSGHFHLTSIKSLPEVASLEWVVDVDEPRAERIAADMGCKWSTSLATALADPAVDIVIIASTTDALLLHH